jgi:hypothetical protein
MPAFSCPSDTAPATHTSYVAIVGDEFAFAPNLSRKTSEFKDGLSETVMVMEVPREQTFEWMDPRDGDARAFLAFKPESKLSHEGGIQVLMGDGASRFLTARLPPETRQALLTIAAGDRVGDF